MPEEINDTLLDELIEVIANNKRHPYYDRTCELRKLYRTLITGEDTEWLYEKYIVTSDAERVKKVKQITNLLIKPISHKLISVFDKIPRASNQRKVIAYNSDTNKTKTVELEGYLGKFWGKKDLDNYFSHRFLKLMNTDPNSFIVIEFSEPEEDLLPQPYPYEVSSDKAIYYSKDLNILEYLVVLDEGDYTIYGKNETIKFDLTDEIKSNSIVIKDNIPFVLNEVEYVKINNKFYKIERPTPHNLGYVPAFQPGYILDTYTEGQTYVNSFDPATPYLLKTIKTVIELDITMSASAFPHRLQYDRACPAMDCNHGYTAEGKECGTCHGSGTWVSKTSFDITTFPIPKLGEDNIPPLSNMIFWSSPDSGIIQFQVDYIDKLFDYCIEIVYNSDTFTKQQVAETATGKTLDAQNVYDVLYPAAVEYANKYVFAVETIADILNLDTDLVVSYVFSKDFQLKTRSQLVEEYKLQKDAGLNEEILDKTEREIIKMDLAGDEQQYLKYSVKKDFAPFGDKTADQINLIVTSPSMTTEYNKILWSNWDNVWDELEMENKEINIYTLPKATISEKLKAKVAEISASIKETQPKTVPFGQ